MFSFGRPDAVKETHRWRCHLIGAGESLCGVTVGPMVCPVVHWIGARSVPCLRAISGGELLCACDQEPKAARRIAYLPLISNDGEQVVTILSNSVALKFGNVAHRTPVRITRTRTRCAPVVAQVVKPFDVNARAIAIADKLPPQDIREYLLHLWSVDVLTRWCSAKTAVAEAVATLVEVSAAARDTVQLPAPAPVSGATALRERLRRSRKVSG